VCLQRFSRIFSAQFGYGELPQAVAESGAEIVERRGTDILRVQVPDGSSDANPDLASQDPERRILLPDEWHVTAIGKINFCVGLGTLQIMDVNLDAHVQIGQYEAHILITNDMLEDLRLRYEIDLLDPNPVSPARPTIAIPENQAPERTTVEKHVGAMAFEGGRSLGEVRFYHWLRDVNYTSPTDPDGVTDGYMSLGFRFTLVTAASVSD